MGTSWGGPTDRESSAYGGMVDGNVPGVALPYHFTGARPTVRVFCNGKTVDCQIVDVGPWYTNDPYWTRTPPTPRALSNSGKNKAIIDITPGAWAALGFSGNLDAIEQTVSWDFVSVLDATPLPAPAPSSVAPTLVTPGTTVLVKNSWPAQSQALSFFGNPAASGWEAANLVDVVCPWNITGTSGNKILIHKKAAASLTRVLNYIWENCGKSQAQIDAFGYNVFDGSYNYRPIAGTSTLSEHAYGGAIDWNAAANPQHATASQTKFKEDSLIVQAFKGEGWTWGGDWSPTYRDAMHVQLLHT